MIKDDISPFFFSFSLTSLYNIQIESKQEFHKESTTMCLTEKKATKTAKPINIKTKFTVKNRLQLMDTKKKIYNEEHKCSLP